MKWIFIVGVNNSGTTPLHRIIGTHPDINTLARQGPGVNSNEGQFHTNKVPMPNDYGVGRLWGLRPDIFHLTEQHDHDPRILDDWTAHLSKPTCSWVAEKSPPDTLRTRWLQKIVVEQTGEAPYFVCIVRNGYAVAEGTRRRLHAELRKDIDISLAAKHWNDANRILLDDSEHLKHRALWKYEDIVADFDEFRGALAEFLDIDNAFSDDFTLTFNINRQQTTGLVDFNAESIARLTPDEIKKVSTAASPMLEEYEYEVL